MKLLILGATGGTGQQLVIQALEQNHQVSVLIRDPQKFKLTHDRLEIIRGNVLDQLLLTKTVEGKDAVLSALGVGKSLKSRDLISNAAKVLIQAMNAKNVKRLIFISAFGVGETFKYASLIQQLIFKLPLKNIYADKAKADEEVRKSNLEWTLVYPVLLTNNPRTDTYRVEENFKMKGMPKISRASVADFMLRQVTDNRFVRKSPIIFN